MTPRIAGGTAAAMAAFAANSVLCRLALQGPGADPVAFTCVRLASGAVLLAALVKARARRPPPAGNWRAAAALALYAMAFSFSYVALTTATGALLLFATVQCVLLAAAALRGERIGRRAGLGAGLAATGLLALLLPGWSAPTPAAAAGMVAAGAAWALYTLAAKPGDDPLAANAGHFARATLLSLLLLPWRGLPPVGASTLAGALTSGALASGLGYAAWYSVLPALSRAQAATVQLCVPVLAAAAGALLLGEPLSPRLLGAGTLVLAGVALAMFRRSA